MIKEAIRQLGRIANALDDAGRHGEADEVDGCIKRLAHNPAPAYNQQQNQQYVQTFWSGFSQLYHQVQNDTNIASLDNGKVKSDLLGIFNQINRAIGHVQASAKLNRTVMASQRFDPSGTSQYVNQINTLLESVNQIPGFNGVGTLLQQALTVLNNATNTQALQQQYQTNQQANEQALQNQPSQYTVNQSGQPWPNALFLISMTTVRCI